MNASFKVLATVCGLLTLPVLASAETTCQPSVLESPTIFPLRSQVRGQSGIVYLDVKIDAQGRATSTELQRSSGYQLLDRAAQQSVKSKWVFDVSDCTRKDLPVTQRIAVDYRYL